MHWYLLVIVLLASRLQGSFQVNITELINEVTPNVFPAILDAESDFDMTEFDVANSCTTLVPSLNVIFIAFGLAIFVQFLDTMKPEK